MDNHPKKKRKHRNQKQWAKFSKRIKIQSAQKDETSKTSNLPAYNCKTRLIQELRKHDTAIIISETGSGKTTQIPKFVYEAGLNGDGVIAITQPRRVATVTTSRRVAYEMGVQIGQLVGYSVRFEDSTSSATMLKYVTDGMLLREALNDATLSKYNYVILDEAHERTINTDVLFGVVKNAQAVRKESKQIPLKIIVMSATMDVDHFSSYFDDAPVLYMEGRSYPIEVYHAANGSQVEDYYFACLVTFFQLHQTTPPSDDILIFLTGQEEIEAMAHTIRTTAKSPVCRGPPVRVYTLYSSLNTDKQLEVFEKSPPGVRKVILSTNIAETSVTISGIKCVVDCGKVKIRRHNPVTGLDTLKVETISQAQAWQRCGRVGRESSGCVYRVYTEENFKNMTSYTVPEIQRCNLSSVSLQLLVMGVNPAAFDFIDSPSNNAISGSFKQLKNLGAISNEEKPTATDLGKKMARFPLDPKYSKILLVAEKFGCLEEISIIVALTSGDSIFSNPPNQRKLAAETRQKFCSSLGDHVTLLNVYRALNKIKKTKKEWCHDNFLNYRNLDYAGYVKSQLMALCKSLNMRIGSCGQNMEPVQKCLLSGLFCNVAHLQKNRKYISAGSKQEATIHPSSSLHGTWPHCVLFGELVQSNQTYLKDVTLVDPDWLTDSQHGYTCS